MLAITWRLSEGHKKSAPVFERWRSLLTSAVTPGKVNAEFCAGPL
jgi:hypothetical protein